MAYISDKIRIIQGDIVKLEVDAVVNAANTTLLGGGGADGAIHRAAGPGLLEECKGLKGCATGEAKVTKGYLLPAKWVIHTVDPVWQGGQKGENDLLASCYIKSLERAREYTVKTIAFLAISTGAYNFPSEKVAGIAVSEINKFIQENELPEKVFLVYFNKETYRHLQQALSKSLRVN
jgi:O-acetyl-ADP-ribose deacetylase